MLVHVTAQEVLFMARNAGLSEILDHIASVLGGSLDDGTPPVVPHLDLQQQRCTDLTPMTQHT